jgi:hypothetical protein
MYIWLTELHKQCNSWGDTWFLPTETRAVHVRFLVVRMALRQIFSLKYSTASYHSSNVPYSFIIRTLYCKPIWGHDTEGPSPAPFHRSSIPIYYQGLEQWTHSMDKGSPCAYNLKKTEFHGTECFLKQLIVIKSVGIFPETWRFVPGSQKHALMNAVWKCCSAWEMAGSSLGFWFL